MQSQYFHYIDDKCNGPWIQQEPICSFADLTIIAFCVESRFSTLQLSSPTGENGHYVASDDHRPVNGKSLQALFSIGHDMTI